MSLVYVLCIFGLSNKKCYVEDIVREECYVNLKLFRTTKVRFCYLGKIIGGFSGNSVNKQTLCGPDPRPKNENSIKNYSPSSRSSTQDLRLASRTT